MSAKIDISPEQLDIVQAILHAHLPKGTLAWAFGSRATWTAKPFSDLDLAVEGAAPLPLEIMGDLQEAFENSDLPWRVDVIDLKSVSPEFRAIVERQRVPADWRPSTWGKEIVLEYGKAIRGYQGAVGQYRVYGTNGPVGWTDEALAQGPGVILGRKGAYRGVHFSDDPFWVIDTAYYVRPLHDELDMRWLYYAIQYDKLGEIDDGSPIPSTTRAAVYVRDFEVPSLLEQEAAAKCLALYDDKIEMNRQMNQTLEALARAVFEDWFVAFGPTRRKMAGETDPVAILGSLVPPESAAPLAPLFPDSFGDNGLPLGWEVRTINDDFDVEMGQSPPGSTYNETGDGLPFFQGRRDFQFRFPEKRVYCSAPTRTAEADWTLISVRAPVGDINRAWEKCCIGRGVGGMMHKRGLASYTYYVGLHLQAELASYDKDGTVFGSINQRQIKGLAVTASNAKVTQAFDELVVPMDEQIRAATLENQTLAATRDFLLPKLMSGELRLLGGEGGV
jgi:type I restriction enzyme S subunit